MVQFKKKPVFTPDSKIVLGLYSIGKEYMYADTLENYIGLYHIYPNSAIYSEARWMPGTSKPLVQYVDQRTPIEMIDEQGNGTGATTLNNSMYYRMTETRFNNYYNPPYHYPEPEPEAYDAGVMTRYFAQRINDTAAITEITPDEFERRNSKNRPGIDSGLYKFLKLEWTIDGPLDDVRDANQRVIKNVGRQFKFVNLDLYLSDLDEFHRNRHKQPE